MNNIEQSARPSVPPQRGSEQALKLRKHLEDVFRNVSLAHDVVTLCVELSQSNTGDFNPEIAHVLRRCAADKLRFQMGVLTKVIEWLGSEPAIGAAETTAARRVTA